MDQLYLNGKKVEIPPKAVALNLQVNDLGELKDRQSDYTNRFKLNLTPTNIEVLEHLGIIGNQSTVPYRNITAKWVVDGVELIPNGFAVIKAVTDKGKVQHYDVHVYNNNIDLYKAIEGKSIRDLDWSDINHQVDYITMIESLDGSKDYIYAIAGYTGKIPVADNFDLQYMLPSVFRHAIWSRIWSEAGFTYSGDVFSSDDWNKDIIGATSFDAGQTNFLMKDFRTILPDISQRQFIKESIWNYGLMFSKERHSNHYNFKHIKDVLKDKAGAVDYSDNFLSASKTGFRLGKYVKKNWLRYNEATDGTTNQDGSIDADIDNLSGSKDLMKSVFQANVTVTPFDYVEVPVFEIDTGNNDVKITDQKPWIARLNYLSDSNQFKDENGVFQTYGGDKPFAQFIDLSFRRAVYFYYREIREMISKAKVREIYLKLNALQVYQFDFMKPIYIKDLGAYFYVNKIKNYRPDTATKLEVIEIPPSVFQIGADTDDPVVDLAVDDDTINVGHTSTFTLTVTEDNIDTWELDFGYGNQKVSGIGQPPTNIIHNYPVGSYTATLTVTDFEGNQGTDTVVMTISAVDNIQIDQVTGEITAPASSVITFRLSITGAGTLSGNAGVSPTDGGSNTLASGQVDNDTVSSTYDSTYESTFTMPANGSAWLTGSCTPIGGGSTGGVLVIQLKLETETETVIVDLNTNFP